MYTIAIGPIPKELQPVVDYNRERWGMEIVTVPRPKSASIEDLVIMSDNLRWERACKAKEPELYCDLDCELVKMPELVSPSLPSWPLDNKFASPFPDTFLMYVDRAFAVAVLSEVPDCTVYCWPRKVLKRIGHHLGIHQIPPECYRHTLYSTHRRRHNGSDERREACDSKRESEGACAKAV